MSHFYNTLEATLIVILICLVIPKKEEPRKPVNTCNVYKCMCKNERL